jgi:hypothetical protein
MYCEVVMDYELIVMPFIEQYLCTISTARPTDSDYINLSSMTSKFHAVTKFIIVKKYKIVNKEYTRINMFMGYFYT